METVWNNPVWWAVIKADLPDRHTLTQLLLSLLTTHTLSAETENNSNFGENQILSDVGGRKGGKETDWKREPIIRKHNERLTKELMN